VKGMKQETGGIYPAGFLCILFIHFIENIQNKNILENIHYLW